MQFYVVVSGEIRVSRRAVQSGDAPEEVNRLHAGSNFGGGALLTGKARRSKQHDSRNRGCLSGP